MFISWNEQQSATPHDKALSKARARSHAARVAHQRTLDRQTRARPPARAKDDLPDPPKQPPLGSLVAWRGNSDPFRSQALDITPRMSQILDFLKTVWVPATIINLPPPFPPSLRSLYCTELMLDNVSADDSPLMLSVLLPCASALASLTGNVELSQQRTKLKLTTIWHLRTRLDESVEAEMASPPLKTEGHSDSNDPEQVHTDLIASPSISYIVPNDTILWLTQSLFITAVNEQNAAEATAHGKMLQWLMRRKTDADGYTSIKADMLCQALGYDIIRSQLTSTPSVFDVDTWVPACQNAHKLAILHDFAPFREKILAGIDNSIRDSPLQRVFLGTYQCFRLWSETHDPSAKLDPDQIWNYVTLTNATLQLQATNYSVVVQRVVAAPTFTTKLARQAQAYWRIQACLVFSVLLWQLTNITDLKIAGQSYWPRGAIIANALREHIQSYCDSFTKSDGSHEGHYQNALLFAYWIGATWQRKSARNAAEVESCFFHGGLCKLAMQYDLVHAEDVKAIVDSFLPTIHMRQQDWKWLDHSLQQHCSHVSRAKAPIEYCPGGSTGICT